MKQVHIPDFLNNISTDCDTLLMQHYSITVRWQRKCTCNIGCMLQVGSHLAYSTPPKTSQPVDHIEAPGESGIGIFHVVESLHWGMIWTMGEWASREIIMKKVNFPLDCQALFFFYSAVPGLMLQQFLDDIHQLRGLTPPFTAETKQPPAPLLEASACTIKVSEKSWVWSYTKL